MVNGIDRDVLDGEAAEKAKTEVHRYYKKAERRQSKEIDISKEKQNEQIDLKK